MLPHSAERAGSSFPQLRGALLIYKTLKLVLLQEGKKKKKGDSPGAVQSLNMTPTDTEMVFYESLTCLRRASAD